MNTLGDLNAWTTADNGATYTQIGVGNVELKNSGDGVFYVTLTDATVEGAIYTKTVDADGNESYTEMEDWQKEDLKEVAESYKAIGYTGGEMYYNIPIEHLNEAAIAEKVIPEAKYGVVRNHQYVVEISKVETIGMGIFDPEEVIVPSPDKELYYVGANINILSWKIVKQNVEL